MGQEGEDRALLAEGELMSCNAFLPTGVLEVPQGGGWSKKVITS